MYVHQMRQFDFREQPDGVYVAGSFDEAISMLTSVPLVDKVDKLFVIGGSSVYKVSSTSMTFKCQQIHKLNYPHVLQHSWEIKNLSGLPIHCILFVFIAPP